MQESNLNYVVDFQRHEWKYFIPNHVLQALIPELLMFMELDPYSKKKRQGAHYVNGEGDPMPCASFWDRNDGGTPVFATHAGVVNGRRKSHGCIRLHYNRAKSLYHWIGAAMKRHR